MLYIHFAHIQGFTVSMSYIKRKLDVITESARLWRGCSYPRLHLRFWAH